MSCGLFEVSDFTVESDALKRRIELTTEQIFAVAIDSHLLMAVERKAFVLALRKKGISTPLLKTKIGTDFPDANFRKGCWEFAEEKIDRMFMHGDLTSYQSRNLIIDQFGGAISITIDPVVTWGIGVSGLKEWEDEAIAIVIAIYVFKIPLEDLRIQYLLDISQNREFFEKLFTAVRQADDRYYDECIAA